MEIRHDWNKEEISKIYFQPLLELVYQAATVHRQYHNSQEIQLCSLLSIKTGGCPEDCSYCPQSARYETGVKAERLMNIEDVLKAAKNAKKAGSSRFCMGAAWRQVRQSKDFDQVIEMIKKIKAMGLEVCVTLGMLTFEQAQKLKEAGVYAYNHNLDTSREYYPEIITTRTYDDRLNTLENARNAGMTVCCGGILGLGEPHEDRISLLHTLSTLKEHPESVPVNTLIAIPGTPLEQQKQVPLFELVRMIATARILMPKSKIRLSAGRNSLSQEDHAFCFLAGANSIHGGEKLLVTEIPGFSADHALMEALGMQFESSQDTAEIVEEEPCCSSKASCMTV